jgi:hypothetical protein
MALIVVSGSCSRRDAPAEGRLLVTATDFFSGDLKRLKAHLDFQGACFKVKATGELRCRPQIELWCDGQRVDEYSRQSYDIDPSSDEVSVSYRVVVTDKGIRKHRIILGGMRGFERVIEEPKSKQIVSVAFGPTTIRKPVEIGSPDDSVIVWALGIGRAPDLADQQAVNGIIEAAPWVILLRLSGQQKKQ